MRRPIYFFLLCIFLLEGAGNSCAQSKFDVPENIEFHSKEDYTRYENTIISAAKWLQDTDLDKEFEKRERVTAFVLKWIAGSPSVTIELTEAIGKLCSRNEELFGVYLAAYSKYVLENRKTAGKFEPTRASLLAIIKVYKKGIRINKNREMENLIRMAEENRLSEYINMMLNTEEEEQKDPVT